MTGNPYDTDNAYQAGYQDGKEAGMKAQNGNEPRVKRPHGLIELRDQGGTLVGDVIRTSAGLTVYHPRLKQGDLVRSFKHPVFVPWSAVLYWSISPNRDTADE